MIHALFSLAALYINFAKIITRLIKLPSWVNKLHSLIWFFSVTLKYTKIYTL